MEIRGWKHKGPRDFIVKGTREGIQPAHASKLETRLDALESATTPEDMDVVPGWRFHEWKGEDKRTYSANVSGNWRFPSPSKTATPTS